MENKNTKPTSQKEAYLGRIAEKQENGLRDVKFFPADVFNVSEEEVYAELNRLNDAPDLPDPDVLGPRSIK